MATLTIQHKGGKISLTQKMFHLGEIVQLWMDRAHQRKQLAQLDAHRLADLGLDYSLVANEIEKPFWK